jgi:hypothetical protein
MNLSATITISIKKSLISLKPLKTFIKLEVVSKLLPIWLDFDTELKNKLKVIINAKSNSIVRISIKKKEATSLLLTDINNNLKNKRILEKNFFVIFINYFNLIYLRPTAERLSRNNNQSLELIFYKDTGDNRKPCTN